MNPTLHDLRREHQTEPIPSEPYRLVADIDAALEQKVPTWRGDSEKRMYISTVRRMILGDEME
tara:strand:- start:967 stop:1155 length:189 start_codon:yes stop_codon:yes gene_type:complete